MRECNVPNLQACLDLTMADVQTLLGKFSATEPEPEWFVTRWRKADPVGKLEALQKLLRE